MNYIKTLTLTLVILFSTTLFAEDSFEKSGQVAADSINSTSGGGLQFIFNKSDKTIVIAFGNFFPTSFTLKPGENTVIPVSSDRQNIIIHSAR